MPKLNHLLILVLLVLGTLAQSCANSQDSALLLQAGKAFVI